MRLNGLIFLCIFLMFLSCSSSVAMVSADVPMVLELTRESEGGETVLKIEIRHGSPTSAHYVDIIEVDVDGEVKKVTVQEPQTTTTFTYSFKLGELEPSSVKVRAHCNIHGWSTWEAEKREEDGGGIPGFPYESIILGLLLGALALWMLQRGR